MINRHLLIKGKILEETNMRNLRTFETNILSSHQSGHTIRKNEQRLPKQLSKYLPNILKNNLATTHLNELLDKCRITEELCHAVSNFRKYIQEIYVFASDEEKNKTTRTKYTQEIN